MPRPEPLPSPGDSAPASSSSGKSVKSSASVRDADYRLTLGDHHIYIQKERPSSEFMRRAQNIIWNSRQSPSIDDETISEIRETIWKNQDKGEEEVRIEIAASIIPGFHNVPEKLQRSHGQLWYKCAPIPLDPDALEPTLLQLPKPKPDLAFGYSEDAFSLSQLRTIRLLKEGSSEKSFASPDAVLIFPFFILEFKSQAKEGSLHTGTNQVAGAGAIAMRGILELWSRSSGLDSFDFDEPRVFSITMDQNVFALNVHWIGIRGIRPEPDQFSYHLVEASMSVLKYGRGIQDLRNAVKNIFDHFANAPLKDIRTRLDTYRTKFLAERDAGPVERTLAGVEPRAPTHPRGDTTPPRPPNKKAKRKTAPKKPAGKKGDVAHEVEEKTHDTRQARATQKGPKQVKGQVTGVRTRRSALATDR